MVKNIWPNIYNGKQLGKETHADKPSINQSTPPIPTNIFYNTCRHPTLLSVPFEEGWVAAVVLRKGKKGVPFTNVCLLLVFLSLQESMLEQLVGENLPHSRELGLQLISYETSWLRKNKFLIVQCHKQDIV